MLNGMIVVRKRAGYTSSDVVAKLRGILHMKKIGHTGTLDPAAEGVLPVCLGTATKLCDLIADHEKEYEAVLRLGVRTDTQDMTGTVQEKMPERDVAAALLQAAREDANAAGIPLPEASVASSRDNDALIRAYVEKTAQRFIGEITQVPPKYSAIWINGTRAYQLARSGAAFEMPSRQVVIHALTIEEVRVPYVKFRVRCSKGTYIRTLCEDLGNALGVGGAMEHLVRTRVGMFTLDEALTLEELDILSHWRPEAIADHVAPVDSFFAADPAALVKEDSWFYLANGNPLSMENLSSVFWPEEEKRTAGSQNRGGIRTQNSPEEALRRDWQRLREREKKMPGALVRMYTCTGEFYAVYHYDSARRRLVCSKMFHEVAGARFNRR